jgi:hypothetical protein
MDGLGFYVIGGLIAACSALRQRVGDIVAGTFVVEEEFSAGVKALAVTVWFAVFVLSGWELLRVAAHPVRTIPPRYLGGTAAEMGYSGSSAHIATARWRIELQLAADSRPQSEVSAAAGH